MNWFQDDHERVEKSRCAPRKGTLDHGAAAHDVPIVCIRNFDAQRARQIQPAHTNSPSFVTREVGKLVARQVRMPWEDLVRTQLTSRSAGFESVEIRSIE